MQKLQRLFKVLETQSSQRYESTQWWIRFLLLILLRPIQNDVASATTPLVKKAV